MFGMFGWRYSVNRQMIFISISLIYSLLILVIRKLFETFRLRSTITARSFEYFANIWYFNGTLFMSDQNLLNFRTVRVDWSMMVSWLHKGSNWAPLWQCILWLCASYLQDICGWFIIWLYPTFDRRQPNGFWCGLPLTINRRALVDCLWI